MQTILSFYYGFYVNEYINVCECLASFLLTIASAINALIDLLRVGGDQNIVTRFSFVFILFLLRWFVLLREASSTRRDNAKLYITRSIQTLDNLPNRRIHIISCGLDYTVKI